MPKPIPINPLEPQRQLTLDQVLGHDAAREYLKHCIAAGQLPQALLLTGPEGVGKKTLAWALIKEIVAMRAEDSAAALKGKSKVARGTHPDVIVCHNGMSNSGQILVDQIHEVEQRVSTSPLEAFKKVAFIYPADRMNLFAANCLLKLLEEPPHHLQLILIANDPALLLPTIRSRCTPLPLEAVDRAQLVTWLVNRGAAPETAGLAADLAEGRPGMALELLEKDALGRRKTILQQLTILKQHGFASVFGVAERLTTNGGGDLAATLATVTLLLRDSMSMALGLDAILNRDLEAELRAFAGGLTPRALLEVASVIENASSQTEDYYTPAVRQHFMETVVVDVGKALRSA